MLSYKENDFIFSGKYRAHRHVAFWLVHIVVITLIYSNTLINQYAGLGELIIMTTLWVVPMIAYAYPIMYVFVPNYLLKEKIGQFVLLLVAWALFGFLLNYLFRVTIVFPVSDSIGKPRLDGVKNNGWAPGGYFIMNAMAGFCCVIKLFKHWMKTQHNLMRAENEKITAELQLLKAQVHPHFLFNTLNNIYSFSLENSPKTPQLILKLSSLLNYVLYDCKTDEVLLEKELSVMKDYIDLEKERYANTLEVSINIEGDIKDKFIAPLLLLPFLENAFKHGTSDQLERPWLSMDLSVRESVLSCKIVNSKNENATIRENGIGIANVRQRLSFLYPGLHELKTGTEPDFFVVSLMLQLSPKSSHVNRKATSVLQPV